MPFSRRIEGVALGLVSLPSLVALVLWPQLPAEMAIHWSSGEPDTFVGKPLGIVGLPALAAGTIAFVRLAPDRLTSTPGGEDLSVLFLGVVFAWVESMVLVWNLGARFPVAWTVFPILVLAAGLVVLEGWWR